jgi:pyruvate/2-oxoglutarate dehydrogenase complex dihydrolipoamide dehydrogenase (E3) component
VTGLVDAGFLTNETVFSLTERPRRVAAIGGGPIGCELAQALQRLGCEVTLVQDAAHVLEREDEDAAAIIQRALGRDGVRLVLSAEVMSVRREGSEKVVRFRHPGGEDEARVDEILVAVGRAPNVDDLGLETAGVEYDRHRGVVVDDNLRTTNPRIFAAGDVGLNWKFTHAADFAARIVIQNALCFGRKRLSALHMPWCTYTTPELAHVGLSAGEAQARGIATEVYMRPLAEVDRAVIDGEDEGFVKVLVKRGTDRILGATIVATHAGDLISEISLAMVAKVGLATIATVIHPYPTQADAIRQIGDLYNRSRLTPTVRRAFEMFLALTR